MSDKENLILGALLHDIGKFLQRANVPLDEEFRRVKLKGHRHAYWSAQFIKNHQNLFSNPETLIDLVLYHGQPGKKPDEIKIRLISIADKLSSMERRREDEYIERENKDMPELSETPLTSVFNNINLGQNEEKDKACAYRLNFLKLEKEVIFPELNYPKDKLQHNDYLNSVKSFIEDCRKLINDDFVTLYYLLHKHIWAVPSATTIAISPKEKIRAYPDISLFDHLRTTAAIALCLFKNHKLFTNKFAEILDQALSEEFAIKIGRKKGILSLRYQQVLKEPLFCLLSADMFGIQKFIYTPSNIPGTSKRLRGRSFYLLMLTEAIARYIIYQKDIDLSIANILYCGGGNFQILLPNIEKIVAKVDEIFTEVNRWLYKEFNGRIGFVFGKIEVSPKDFDSWDEVLKRLDNKVAQAKKEKIKELLSHGDLFIFEEVIEGRKDICKSCTDATISYGEEICHYCQKHKEIGEKLPKIIGIVFHQGNGRIYSKNNKDFETYEIKFNKFGKVTLIIQKTIGTLNRPQLTTEGDIFNLEYLKLNDTKEFIDTAVFDGYSPSFGFKFLANRVPSDKNGKILEFEEIANKSQGVKKIGILKMDVDHLGLILKIGFSYKQPSDRTISRIATMSRMMDIFFSGYIHKICEGFPNVYITYSGGDDLFLVGPWSDIPHLAKRIYEDFREYTCKNPDITLSAGIFICGPKFPVKRFAPLVSEELNNSKSKGRDRITIFGESASWCHENNEISFAELIEFGNELYGYLNQRKITRGFLHELLQTYSIYFGEDGKEKKLYIPYLIYQITRNIKEVEVRNKLYEKLITSCQGIKWMKKIKIPVTYALLKSRR